MLAVAVGLVALGLVRATASAAVDDGPHGGSAAVAPSPFVAVADGRVTIDAHDAELVDVLARLAALGEFRLTTKGQLGRVTATVTADSLERALRQVVQDHEVVLVYGSSGGDHGEARLLQVGVFAASANSRSPGPGNPSEQASVLRDIWQLARSPNDPHRVQKLVELLGNPDATIRGRAAWALGQVGGPAAVGALGAAVRDAAPDVRQQAIYALRTADAARAIPILAAVLANDADAGVRKAAARMLGSLPGSEAASALGAAVQDRDQWVRREVERGLQRHGVH